MGKGEAERMEKGEAERLTSAGTSEADVHKSFSRFEVEEELGGGASYTQSTTPRWLRIEPQDTWSRIKDIFESEPVSFGPLKDEDGESNPIRRRSTARSNTYLKITTLLLALALIIVSTTSLTTLSGLKHQLSSYTNNAWILTSTSHDAQSQSPSRNAFLTFLGAYSPDKDSFDLPKEDIYLTAVRILVYQFVHAPLTKSIYPFVVAVAPEVTDATRSLLTSEGAIIVELPSIHTSWSIDEGRWKDVLDKLGMFAIEGYDKLCFIDADTVLRSNMDGVFDDSGAQWQETKNITGATKDDEEPMPERYMFASHTDRYQPDQKRRRSLPDMSTSTALTERTQDYNSPNYFNAGFMLFSPSPAIYAYYLSVLEHPDRFFIGFGEQSVLNYAHRRDGNMPWASVAWAWNVFKPDEADMRLGVKSLHGHLWDGTWPFGYEGERNKWWLKMRAEMEEFWGGKGEADELDVDGGGVADGTDRVRMMSRKKKPADTGS